MHQLMSGHDGDLGALCAWLCPSLDVDLEVMTQQGELKTVVHANDWQVCEEGELLDRITGERTEIDHRLHDLTRPISDGEKYFGRAAIWPRGLFNVDGVHSAVITTGGVRTDYEASGMVGLLLGDVVRAARDIALPSAPTDAVIEWATEQARLASNGQFSIDEQLELSSLILALGGDSADLKIAETNTGALSKLELRSWVRSRSKVRVLHDASLHLILEEDEFFLEHMDDDVLVVTMGRPVLVSPGGTIYQAHDCFWPSYDLGRNTDEFCEAIIAQEWGVSEQAIYGQVRAQRDLRAESADRIERIEVGKARGLLAQEIGCWSNGGAVTEVVYTITRSS
jgi:hypothetical protein